MFCRISRNWRAAPLTSRLTAVELITNTRTKAGLSIRCERDTNSSPKGIKVSDEKMASLNLKGDDFHPEWSYTISSREQKAERQFLGPPYATKGVDAGPEPVPGPGPGARNDEIATTAANSMLMRHQPGEVPLNIRADARDVDGTPGTA